MFEVPYEEIQFYLQDVEAMPKLSPKEMQEVIEQMVTAPTKAMRDAARNRLIEAHLGLVIRLAIRYCPLGPALSDLVAEGNLALTMAAHQFDPQRSKNFRSFATRGVSWALYHLTREHLQQMHRTSMEPISPLRAATLCAWRRGEISEEALGMDLPEERFVSLDLLDEDTDEALTDEHSSAHADLSQESDPEATFLAHECRTCLESSLQTLTERERFVLNYRFLEAEQTLEAIGKKLRVTREFVRQIEGKAIGKMRQPRIARRLYSLL